MLLSIPQCTEQTLQRGISIPKMSAVPKLKNPTIGQSSYYMSITPRRLYVPSDKVNAILIVMKALGPIQAPSHNRYSVHEYTETEGTFFPSFTYSERKLDLSNLSLQLTLVLLTSFHVAHTKMFNCF